MAISQAHVKSLHIDTVLNAATKGRMNEIMFNAETKKLYSYIVDNTLVHDGVQVLTANGTNGYWKAISGASANNRVLADETTVAPAVAGQASKTEIEAFVLAGTITDSLVIYTGTDLVTDPVIDLYNVDASGTVTQLNLATAFGGVKTWAASTNYLGNDLVKTPAGAIVQRNTAGTSTAAFDATEALDWTLIKNASPIVWAISTYYYTGDRALNPDRPTTILEAIADNYSVDINTVAEVVNWRFVSQSSILLWVTGKAYFYGEQVVSDLNNTFILTKTFTGVDTQVNLSDNSNWIVENNSGSTIFDYLSIVDAPTLGTGTAESVIVEGENSSKLRLTDTSTTNASKWDIKSSLIAAGDTIAIKYTFSEIVTTNKVIKLGLSDGTSSSYQLINLGSGALVGTQIDTGTILGTTTVREYDLGTPERRKVEVIQKFKATTSLVAAGNYEIYPSINADGSAIVNVASIENCTLIDIKLGHNTDFDVQPIPGASALLFDSSLAIDAKTLPIATGSGNVLYYANKNVQLNNATLQPQAGEYINNELNAIFYASNYADGIQIIATDSAPGRWSVSVDGASTSRNLDYALFSATAQANGAGGYVIWDVASNPGLNDGNFAISVDRTSITLKANKTYKIDLGWRVAGAGISGSNVFSIFDITNNIDLGKNGISSSLNTGTNDSNRPISTALVTPITDIQIVAKQNSNLWEFEGYLSITELPSTETVLAGMLTVDGNVEDLIGQPITTPLVSGTSTKVLDGIVTWNDLITGNVYDKVRVIVFYDNAGGITGYNFAEFYLKNLDLNPSTTFRVSAEGNYITRGASISIVDKTTGNLAVEHLGWNGGCGVAGVIGIKKQKTVINNKDMVVDKTNLADGDVLTYDLANDRLVKGSALSTKVQDNLVPTALNTIPNLSSLPIDVVSVYINGTLDYKNAIVVTNQTVDASGFNAAYGFDIQTTDVITFVYDK